MGDIATDNLTDEITKDAGKIHTSAATISALRLEAGHA